MILHPLLPQGPENAHSFGLMDENLDYRES